MSEQETRQVARTWFDALDRGDVATAMSCLADDVVWVNLPKVPGVSAIIPWLGTCNGKAEVARSFQIRDEVSEVKVFHPLKLSVEDDEAFGTFHDYSQVRATGRTFDIEFATWFKVEGSKITQWKSYCDPSPIVAAFRDAPDTELVEAVLDDNLDDARRLLTEGADVNARNADTDQTVLMIAACHARPDMVKLLLDAGADIHALESQTGASALHKACQGGDVDVVRLLVERGAFVDLPAPTTGHTPVMEALWYKWPEVVDYLLAQGADVNLSTHYGFTLWDHLAFETKVNVIDGEKMETIKHLFDAKRSADAEAQTGQPLMAAVQRGDVEAVKVLIREGADVNAVYPRINSFLDGHTPLLVAARDGHQDIVAELLAAGADVHTVDWVFKGSPIHKATYNGNPSILAMLVAHPDVDINVQGPINGYTPLHDALWHGFTECASMLLDANASLDLRGHDGKTPLDVAADVYGSGGIVDRIRAAMEASSTPLNSPDEFAIEQLNSRYFHALDGLRGAASDRAWAECFTPDGRFRILDARGTTIAEAKGTKALVELYATFPDVATTRHWVNNLLMEKAGDGARTTCYIIAMDIGGLPSTIARTGLYTDDLTKTAGGWRYTNRTLALDPNSPPPS